MSTTSSARTDAQRKRRLIWIGGGLVALIAIVAVVIATAGGSSNSNTTSSTTATPAQTAQATNQYAGIPQKGNVLGTASAPATMVVFADMQCPFCREFETQAFPSIVKRYVKAGKLRVIFEPISILGSDSIAGAHAVASAGEQNKLFDYMSSFYANQGEENTGYVTTDFMTNLAKQVDGLDVTKWKNALGSDSVNAAVSKAASEAQRAQVSSTPTFMVGKTGQSLSQFQPNQLNAAAFYGKLDQLTQ